MEKIRSEKELQERFEQCGACLQKKFRPEPGHRAIVVCGDTGCISLESEGILEAFEQLIKEHHMEDKVTVNRVGCLGFCSQGPFVKMFPEETLYTKVTPKDAKEIFE